VGNINTPDGEYNAARWNGSEWEFMGIYSNTLDLYSIWYFAEDDIWVLSSYPIHWDGESWTHYHLTEMGIIPGGLGGSIWGASPNDVWFVGRYGRIVHYDGSRFRRVESGTDVDLKDMDGTPDGKHVFVAGATLMGDLGGHGVFLHIEEGNPNIVYTTTTYGGNPENGNYGRMHTLTVTDSRVYANPGGVDMLVYEIIPDIYHYYPVKSTVLRTDYYSTGNQVRGKRNHDILFISPESVVVHYNGSSLKIMMDLLQLYGNNMLWIRRARYTDNLAVIVGLFDSGIPGGIIVKGVHQE
jgi:hypothetical protein